MMTNAGGLEDDETAHPIGFEAKDEEVTPSSNIKSYSYENLQSVSN